MSRVKTRIVKRSRFNHAVNGIPLVGGLNMEIRPHAELVLRGKETTGKPLLFETTFYKTGGVKVFMGAVRCKKDIVDSTGNVVLQKGERFLSPHLLGNNPWSIAKALKESIKFVRANKEKLKESGIVGIVFEPGSETYATRAKRLGGTEVEPSRLHKFLAPYTLKFMGKYFPSNIPKIENITMKRIVLRLDQL